MMSVSFFTCLAASTRFCLCFCNWLKNGKCDIYTIIFMVLVGNLSCLFESSSRVTEYVIYAYPKLCEGIWDTLEKFKLVKPIPFARQLIQAVSIGTALVLYRSNKEVMPQSYKNMINLIFGKSV